MVPLRVAPVEFNVYLKLTLPGPKPAEEVVSHAALLVAVHWQFGPALTAKLALPGAEETSPAPGKL